MGLFRLFIVLSIIIGIPIKAQTKITLDNAINLAFQNNLELFKQATIIKKAEVELNESARFPNPAFSYSREDLVANQLNFDEWSASGSIPINFLWERWSNIASKDKLLEAQKLLYKNLKLNTAVQVCQNYYSFHHYLELHQSFFKMLKNLTKLTESVQHRFSDGDISEYELQRILVELNKVKSVALEIEQKKIELENKLKLLIGIDTQKRITTVLSFSKKEMVFSEKDLIELANNSRNDIKAFSLMIESEESNLSFNKTKLLPDINLTAGYKKQSDELKGSLFQVDFEIPLFNRNQTQIEQSEIELSILRKELLFLKEEVKKEVIESLKKYQLNKKLLEDTKSLKFENIYTTSAFSYEQGEITLVEFIDGINAFVDGIILAKQTENNYQSSYFNLEKAVGVSLTNFEYN